MRALVIEPGKAPALVDQDWNLEALQTAVGGYIESIATPFPNTSFFGHDEAKFVGEDGGPLPRNVVIDAILRSENLLLPGDFIAGPVVVIGWNPETGEDTDLSGEVEAAIQAINVIIA